MGYKTDFALQALVMDLQEKFKMRNALSTEYLEEAVVYLRYSTHKQDGGVSLEYQINEALYYAEREKLRITGWYIDTAKTAKEVAGRDDFIRLFNDVEAGNIPPNLIVFATNRAFRNTLDSLQHRQILRDNNIRLHSATQRIDEKTSGGRLQINVMASIDQYKSEEVSDFVSAATKYLITDGFFAGGREPYGFVAETVIHNGKERRRVIPYEPEAAIVREIFESVAAGKNLNQIAVALKERGILTRKGLPFTFSTLRRMLRNVIYKGERIYKIKNGDTAYSQNYCTPVISAELFDKANAFYSKYEPQTKGRKRQRIYPLTGKLVCADCGRPFTGRSANTFLYYGCQSKSRLICECNSKQIRKTELEKAVFEAVKENILSDNAINDITKKILSKIKKAPAAAESKKELITQQATLEKEIAEIVQMKLKNQITESVMEMMVKDKNAELSAIAQKLRAFNASAGPSINAAYIKKRLGSIFDKNAIFEECSAEVLKELFQQTIENVEISNTQVVIHLRVPLSDITHKKANGLPNVNLNIIIARP